MFSDRARGALFEIRDNIALAQEFLGPRTVQALEADRRSFYAIVRCLEIVSEAARRLPQEMRDRHSDLPWKAIMGVGNIYRHDYDNVAEELVWRTVRDSLPPLLAAVNEEISLLRED